MDKYSDLPELIMYHEERISELMDKIDKLDAELSEMYKRVEELEKENQRLKTDKPDMTFFIDPEPYRYF